MLRDMRMWPADVKDEIAVSLALCVTEFDYWQTGSRFMGGWRQDSDWDFIAQDSPEIRQALTGNGFIRILDKSSDYCGKMGDLTDAVFERRVGSLKVQVQLAHDLPRKRAARDLIASPVLFKRHLTMSKIERREMWDDVSNLIARWADEPLTF